MYDHFKDLKEGSCEEALAIAQDAHWWVLVAMALLWDKIDRLSHSLSPDCWHSRSHMHLGSHCWKFQAPQAEVHQGGYLRDGSNIPALGGQEGASLLRMTPKRHQSQRAHSTCLGRHWRNQNGRGGPGGPGSPQPLPGGFPSWSRRQRWLPADPAAWVLPQ